MLLRAISVFALWGSLAAMQAADNPFVGKWKFNRGKSHLAGQQDSVRLAGPNRYEFTYGAFSWTIPADGTDQPVPLGGTTALTAASPDMWKFSFKVNGKATSTETWSLAPDGKSMLRANQGTREDGSAFQYETKLSRVSGGKGFEGTWQSSEINVSSPDEVIITPNGDDGLTQAVPADSVTMSFKFDGSDYPVQGPKIPAGLTVASKRSGPHEMHLTAKLNGKVLNTQEVTISANAKNMTLVEHDAGVKAPVVAVYDRE